MSEEPVIDTMLVGYERDGTPLYMSVRDAGLVTAARGLVWVINHPRESLQGVALAAAAGLCGYLLYDSWPKPKPERKPVRRTLRRKAAR
jgi:hypothetical protein